MMLIVEPVGQRREAGEIEGHARYARMLEFRNRLDAQGVLGDGQSLRSENDGVRIRNRSGKTQRFDGPFAETKEMIGGFFVLNCATKDEAVEIAQTCPAADWATIEVREFGPCFT
jgi:hypothetical protein